jgi:formamidopyrimidine-DNA glycosylase
VVNVPELPEVEAARRYLHERAIDHRIEDVIVLDPKMLIGDRDEFVSKVLRRKVVGTGRHGKHLFLMLDRGALRIHLGMSGSVHLVEDDESTPHQRLRLELDRSSIILDDPRRFGRFQYVDGISPFVKERGLGPDALSISEGEFVSRAGGRKEAIKSVLLDQSILAGVGNLYADEVLFQERVVPSNSTASLSDDDLAGICRRVGEVLSASIAAESDFSSLPTGYLLKDRRKDGRCPRCGQGLWTTVVGGRTTIFCPSCQR